jgi:hypothetical protein
LKWLACRPAFYIVAEDIQILIAKQVFSVTNKKRPVFQQYVGQQRTRFPAGFGYPGSRQRLGALENCIGNRNLHRGLLASQCSVYNTGRSIPGNIDQESAPEGLVSSEKNG